MAWDDDVNAVWRQVGSQVGAEFEFRELTTESNGRIQGEKLIGTLVKKSAQSNITLEYRARKVYSWSDAPDDIGTTTKMQAHAGTQGFFSFRVRRPGLRVRRSTEIGRKRYLVKSSDQDVMREVLEDEEVRQLIPAALGRGDLVLAMGILRFTEDSHDNIRAFPFPVVEWKRPISDPQRLKALFQLFEAVLDRLPQAPPSDPALTSGEEAADPFATKARRRWALRSTYYFEGRVIDLDAEGGRLVIQKLDSFIRSDWSTLVPRKWLFFVPDPRLSRSWQDPGETHEEWDEPDYEDIADALNLGGFRLSSVRVKRFPVFGGVESVRWNNKTGIEPEVERFSKRVADALSENSQLEEAVKEADIDLRIKCLGIWVVFAPFTATLNRPVRECFQIIAEALLGLPISANEQDAQA